MNSSRMRVMTTAVTDLEEDDDDDGYMMIE